MIISLSIVMFLCMLLSLFWIINMYIKSRESLSPFECGFDPLGNARIPFSIRFFLVAILFLIFDIEIVILMTLPLYFNMISMMGFMMFLGILILGTWHEFNEGTLDWVV